MPNHGLGTPKTARIRFGLSEYMIRWLVDILVVTAVGFHQSLNGNRFSTTMQYFLFELFRLRAPYLADLGNNSVSGIEHQ